jgi:contact-dependent growth inhibition (CDI) system restriction endonuclease-like protein
MVHQMWRLSEGGEDNFGLACTDEGLILGRTPLIERRDDRFVVRELCEVERLLSRAYRMELTADRLMPGLATVAAALNADDQCLARIAAVHLRIPDLPDRAARDDMEAVDALIKYARDEGAGGTDWNPVPHPRTGAPPNPGWFAPTGGDGSSSIRTAQNDDPTRRTDASPSANDDWVRLPPARGRIDELADFIEWIANAKPENEQAIRAEIKRYFDDVGWQSASHDLNGKLTVVLKPGVTRAQRQQILNLMDAYTRVDPAEYVRNRDIVTGLSLLLGSVPPVAPVVSHADAWKLGWAARGRYFEERLGRTLHPGFPTIDKIPDGIATSIKSIDLNAATYQDAARLTYRLNKYIDDVTEFQGASLANDRVKLSDIKGRALSLAIPTGSVSAVQQKAIEAVRLRAGTLDYPVELIITEF